MPISCGVVLWSKIVFASKACLDIVSRLHLRLWRRSCLARRDGRGVRRGSAGGAVDARGRHIKKRALKNKALSVSFNEKDLRDYAARRKRIEQRKKRKLEKEFALYGGALPSTCSGPDEVDENNEDDEKRDATASVSVVEGTTKYDGENMTVTVITSEISRVEEEGLNSERTKTAMLKSVGDKVDRKQALAVRKSKPFKKVAKHRSKTPSKREKNKGKKRDKNRH
ncbi:hypothetical protein V6N11_030519 [Hibiscus sabdariffa]|uniref:Nucleolar protein 12 n=1 Tax=Hibiscus sabdariffa TaxID=183260 RepID=A0ABR2PL48_9ROSI